MGSPGREKVFSVSLLVQTMLCVSLFLTNEVENKQASDALEPNLAIPTNTSILIFSVNFRNFSIQKPGNHSQTRQENSLLASVPFYQRRIGVLYISHHKSHFSCHSFRPGFFCRCFTEARSSLSSSGWWFISPKWADLSNSEGHVELWVPVSRQLTGPLLLRGDSSGANGSGLCLLTHTRIY